VITNRSIGTQSPHNTQDLLGRSARVDPSRPPADGRGRGSLSSLLPNSCASGDSHEVTPLVQRLMSASLTSWITSWKEPINGLPGVHGPLPSNRTSEICVSFGCLPRYLSKDKGFASFVFTKRSNSSLISGRTSCWFPNSCPPSLFRIH